MSERGEFLAEKYKDLPGASEVESAVRKPTWEGQQPGPKTKEDRIEAYLERLERLAIDPEHKQKRKMLQGEYRPRALLLLREMVMNKYVRPNKKQMAQGAARVEERAARQMGVQVQYDEQALEQRGEIAVEDLEKSLDQWISYLSDANEPYPTWFRYYVFRNILNLTDYDKDKGEFSLNLREDQHGLRPRDDIFHPPLLGGCSFMEEGTHLTDLLLESKMVIHPEFMH